MAVKNHKVTVCDILHFFRSILLQTQNVLLAFSTRSSTLGMGTPPCKVPRLKEVSVDAPTYSAMMRLQRNIFSAHLATRLLISDVLARLLLPTLWCCWRLPQYQRLSLRYIPWVLVISLQPPPLRPKLHFWGKIYFSLVPLMWMIVMAPTVESGMQTTQPPE